MSNANRINTLYNQAIEKLSSIGMSDEEMTHVLSRAIVASAAAMNKGSVLISFQDNISVQVDLPTKLTPSNEQMSDQSKAQATILH